MATDSPPPPEPGQYWLKLESVPGSVTPSRYAGFYLRQNSVADPAVMIVAGPPKFLRAHDGLCGGVELRSWKNENRNFALVLRTHPAGKAGWERVEIPQDETDDRLTFVKHADGSETLEGPRTTWTGWMVCEWSLGHPQLFWTTSVLTTPLPSYCEQVVIVREFLV